MQNAALSVEARSLELIARDLLSRQPGERLPTVAQYQERLGIGSGTVQARLRTLVSIGAIALRARGHQGTFLVERNLAELWSHGRLGPVRGLLPLPEAFEPVSLAAVIREQFQLLQVPLELLYLHGSSKRIQMVRDGGAHFAVVSGPAGEDATGNDRERWLTLEFGPETYNADGSMVVLLRPHLGVDDRVTRIGIDPASHDHSLLTRAEFPEEDGYVYAAYPHARLPAAVAEGAIDAAVWHRTTLAVPLSAAGIAVRPIHQPEAIELRRVLGHAVLLADAGCPEAVGVLNSIDLSGTRRVQEEILRSEMLPLY